MTMPLSAEIELLAACCRWPPSDARQEATRAAAAAVDWAHFERVVARHRVAGLVADGLRRAGVAVPASIAASATFAARQALAMARETVRLQHAFDAAGLSAIFVKGASLALVAYRELAVKQSWDIDLLVDAGNAVAARRLLENLGYRLTKPDLSEDRFVRFLSIDKECVFTHEALGIAVELHWRLVTGSRLLPNVGIAGPLQEVRLGGQPVRTLAAEPLFAYLCVHGGHHGWARLKWLADVNALLAHETPERVDSLYFSAVRLGAGRTPAAALLLCERLFGLPLTPHLARALRKDRRTRSLVTTALRCIAHGRGAEEIGRYSATNFLTSFSHFFLVPGARYVWSQVREKWASPQDRTAIDLPPPLRFLYPLIRVPTFLARLCRSWRWARA